MYIVSDFNNNIETLRSKYLVLELDTTEINGKEIHNYCVIDNEHVSLQEIPNIENFKELHQKLIENYHKKNWNYCEQAIEFLRGKFKGEIDTFYDDLLERIAVLKEIDLPETWNGNIILRTEK